MTRRAILIGFCAVLLIGIATPYTDLVMKGTWTGLTAFPINALFVLVWLVLIVNPLLRRLKRGLRPGELLLIYGMCLVAGGLPSFGLTGLLIPYIAGPFYFARPENKYEQILHPLIPSWLHPQSEYAIVKLYEGLRPGERIPWGEWLLPLAAWTAMAGAMYFAFFCLTTLLRRRWIEDEKLVFPLLQLPVALAMSGDCTGQTAHIARPLRPGSAAALAHFLRDPVMWGFFALPFFIHALNGLHYYFPALPYMNVHQFNLGPYLTQRPWNAMQPLYLRTLFSIIGLAYVLPSELSFSLWLFYFFFLLQTVIASALGLPLRSVQAYGTKELVAHQMWGGIMTAGVLGLWAARERLRQIWIIAQQKEAGATAAQFSDDGEPLPYRVALGGLGISWLAIGVWGAAAGAQWGAVLGLIALYFLSHIVAVRLVCEGGMLYVQHPYRPFNMFLAAFGSRSLGPHNIAILAYLDHLWMVDNRSPLMPALMQSWKLAEEGALAPRRLAKALAGAIALAILSSYGSYLTLMYRYGGATLHPWFTAYYTRNLYCNWTIQLLTEGERPRPGAFVTMAIGAASYWGLTLLHHHFLWWPLHPIGYLMGASWPMINFWFPVLVGWLCKTAILHYGGPKIYRRLLPGFLGLVLAEFTAAGLWVLVDFFAGVRGHEVFSF